MCSNIKNIVHFTVSVVVHSFIKIEHRMQALPAETVIHVIMPQVRTTPVLSSHCNDDTFAEMNSATEAIAAGV